MLYAFGDVRPDSAEVCVVRVLESPSLISPCSVLTDPWSDKEKHYPGDSWNDVGENLYGCLKQLHLLKKRHRHLKVLLSIGGWTYAHDQKHFDVPASTEHGRRKFAASCVQLIKDYGFDGIDVDWEYPQNAEQGEQLLLLLMETRRAMEEYADELAQTAACEGRPRFELSIAAPAGEQNYKHLPFHALRTCWTLSI